MLTTKRYKRYLALNSSQRIIFRCNTSNIYISLLMHPIKTVLITITLTAIILLAEFHTRYKHRIAYIQHMKCECKSTEHGIHRVGKKTAYCIFDVKIFIALSPDTVFLFSYLYEQQKLLLLLMLILILPFCWYYLLFLVHHFDARDASLFRSS